MQTTLTAFSLIFDLAYSALVLSSLWFTRARATPGQAWRGLSLVRYALSCQMLDALADLLRDNTDWTDHALNAACLVMAALTAWVIIKRIEREAAI